MSENAYLGNPNLKKVNTPVEFSKEEVVRISKVCWRPIILYGKLCSYRIT